MSLVSMMAKEWTLEVDTSTTGTPTWTTIKGLRKLELPIDNQEEDDSDFDSGGWGSKVVTQRMWSISCEGLRKRDQAIEDFTPDPGQEVVRQAGELVGFDAYKRFRWYRKDGAPDAFTGTGSVKYEGGGGGVTELEPFKFTVLGNWQRTTITNPAAA